MVVSKSSFSVGEIIHSMLVKDSEVMKRATKVFPIVSDTAILPYVLYRRKLLSQDKVKGSKGADTIEIEILCCTENYTEGVELAEAVRRVLDGANGEAMRSCYLENSKELWRDDAFIQQLVFKVKI